MEIKREELCPGVWLTAIRTGKFKSATLGCSFLTPLDRKTAALNALVPHVLRRGCEGYPTMAQVSARLENLYGGALEPVVRRRGETQGVGLLGSFLDDAYTLDEEPNLDRAADLLTRMLLKPVTEQGVFRADYVAGEKENLIQAIRGELNDKLQYAVLRLTQEMCRDEAYSVGRMGREEEMAAATPQSVWAAYKALLSHAQVEVHYCGNDPIERVKEALAPLVSGLAPCRGEITPLRCEVRAAPDGPVKTVEERLDVTQGKLNLGFRIGGAWSGTPDAQALTVFNALYSASPTSKLFTNVRERLSLCYYVRAEVEKVKGIMVVYSGVEFDRMEQAQAEILAQLDAVKEGDFTDEELENARQEVINALRSSADSRGSLEQYCFTAAVTGVWLTPEEREQRVLAVTREDVCRVARRMTLDTVYHLLGKEGAGHD